MSEDVGLIAQSDKFFWHGYVDFYAPFLSQLQDVRRIVEVGVLRGHSIRWLRSLFPEAQIYGLDILPVQDSWPDDERIHYVQIDQGQAHMWDAFFDLVGGDFDLVIEDGSHLPQHQALTLAKLLPHVRSGGLYILEDAHTSFPTHDYYYGAQKQLGQNNLMTAYHVLHGLMHLMKTDRLESYDLSLFAQDGLFAIQDIFMLVDRLRCVHFYKRSVLPERCWRCSGQAFDYQSQLCSCGEVLIGSADSMAFVCEV